jgi:single-stranded-DNA-specific exonuclease
MYEKYILNGGVNFMTKVWNVRKYDEDTIKLYCSRFNISSVLAKLLIAREVSLDMVDKYLNTKLNDLYDPFLMKDMDKLVDRVLLAKERSEKVIIYGDYDVDGVTSITILYSFLKELGLDVHYYLPDRMEEGYGLNKDALCKIKELGYSLVITVDCGISAIDEVEYAKSIGLEICITDHHECGEIIPSAYAVVNPNREDCTMDGVHPNDLGFFRMAQKFINFIKKNNLLK